MSDCVRFNVRFVPPWLTHRHSHTDRQTHTNSIWPAYMDSSASWAK